MNINYIDNTHLTKMKKECFLFYFIHIYYHCFAFLEKVILVLILSLLITNV